MTLSDIKINRHPIMKTSKWFAIIILILLYLPLSAQKEGVDLEMIYKIKQEGLKNSEVQELAFWMTDYIGPRLSGSSGLKRGYEWTSKKMTEMGLENVRIEPWGEFGPGWDNHKAYAAMLEPYYSQLIGTPRAWTAGIEGTLKSEVILVSITGEEDFDKYRGKLQGKIVTTATQRETPPAYEPSARRLTEEDLQARSMMAVRNRRRFSDEEYATRRAARALRNKINEFFSEEGVAAILSNSGSFGTVRSGGASRNPEGERPTADFMLTTEHHGRIVRLLQHEVPVIIELEIENRFLEEDKMGYNVIGEIPGTDKSMKNEIVLIGAHLDSWHGGTGANDNASGCIVMMEAMRILKAVGFKPKRTIQIGLWGAEEQGLYGSRGYVSKYLGDRNSLELKPGHAKFSAYYNVDNGSGKIRGIHLQENDMVKPIFETWFAPFEDMGASTISIRSTGGTDHLAFDALGLPAYQFIQDPINYGRGYHTNMDTYERLQMQDMMHNAVIVASMVYHTAQRQEKLPRKPLPEKEKE